MQKILIVEDDRELNRTICYTLKKEGYDIYSAYSVREAKAVYRKEKMGLILLDVNLRDLEEDALEGYGSGAEDYITKPFSIKILKEKIRVVLKREKAGRQNFFDDGFLKIDFERAKVEAGGKECTVTPTEFRLLRQFVLNKGQLLTYAVLLERIWDNGGCFVDKHTLAVNVNRLRKKIEDGEHQYISNIYGMGYQWLES